MAPQTVVIVGGVLITVSAGIAFKEYAWPHIKEFVEPKLLKLRAECEARFHTTFGPRRRSQPHHHTSPSDSNYIQREKREVGPSENEKRMGAGTYSPNSDRPGIRRRQIRPESDSQREVEMIQLDNSPTQQFNLDKRSTTHQTTSVTPMSSTLTRSPRQNAGDINPFEDPKDSVLPSEPATIPLPQSPVASFTSSNTSFHQGGTNPACSRSPPSGSSLDFATRAWMQPNPAPPTASYNDIDEPLTPRSPPLPALSPPMILSEILSSPQIHSASRDSPISRVGAASPSISEAASFVSATPSRTWTEGGTDRIFSDAEHDFRGNESDDDVESVSESGSWENVSAGPGSPNLGSSGRLTR